MEGQPEIQSVSGRFPGGGAGRWGIWNLLPRREPRVQGSPTLCMKMSVVNRSPVVEVLNGPREVSFVRNYKINKISLEGFRIIRKDGIFLMYSVTRIKVVSVFYVLSGRSDLDQTTTLSLDPTLGLS